MKEAPTVADYKAAKEQEKADAEAAAADEAKMAGVNKVINMLEELQRKVLAEGEKEAASYNKFACFCQDTTAEKNEQITKGQDDSASLRATIVNLNEHRDDLEADMEDYTEDIRDTDEELKEATAQRKETLGVYEKNAADLNAALAAIDGAIEVLKASKKPSLMQIQTISKTLQTATIMADALGLPGVSNAQKEVAAFFQQPAVEMEDYKFHSDTVIESLEHLKADFRETMQNLDSEETTSVAEFEAVRQEKLDHIKDKTNDLNKARAERDRTTGEIGMATNELTTTNADLLDNQQYLKELAEMCEATAKTWDQRSNVRADELSALVAAIAIVKDGVKGNTSSNTVRFAQQGVRVQIVHNVATNPKAMELIEAEAEAAEGSPSFLQKRSVVVAKHSQVDPSEKGRLLVAKRLAAAGQKMRSTLLTSMAMRVKQDPYAKIKKIMQDMIEKLMQEAIEEANSKGFCDKAFGEANQKRDLAVEKISELNANMASLEATRDKLTEQLETLAAEIADLNQRRSQATQQRSEDETQNSETTTEAEAGLEAVKSAIDILDKFYKTAAKDKVELELMQEQPSIDAPNAGFEIGESYNAGQGESQGILGMLDVIKSDFERTISVTAKTEETQAKEYEKFMGESGVSLFEKNMATEMKTKQKDDAIEELEEDDDSLTSQTDILKIAVQELLDLQPTCVNTGMTYNERVAQREEEIQNLKIALCTIKAQADGVDADAAAAECGTTAAAGTASR